MRAKYNFSKSVKNPYAKRLKQQVTMLMDKEVIEYFKQLSAQTGIAYQVLINLYLLECVKSKKNPDLRWVKD
ncbi:MAG: antitoxin [Deltaproteobacteria bacterium RIFCSPHIGHO2_02_FULL_40_11]|nr:MAG: antitoxin [Deltaproteobacteria bacterium RIFCSPHIGHO2_02_FULL_40_11]